MNSCTKLESGKRELLKGKKEYEKANKNLFKVLADKLLRGGKGFTEARKRIAEGDKQVAKGEDDVDVGERRLDASELKLGRGREQVRLAKSACFACAIGAALFASLSIVLGFCWRLSLVRLFMHHDAWQVYPDDVLLCAADASRSKIMVEQAQANLDAPSSCLSTGAITTERRAQ